MVSLLVVQMGKKGVEEISLFDSDRPDPNCFWVKVVGTPEQLQSPTGVYRKFLNKIRTFENGTAFEKACITFDRRLSFSMIERLIPPHERYGFAKMLCSHSLPGSSRAKLYDNMDLEVRRDRFASPAEFDVELIIWQGEFKYLLNPEGAYDTLLRFCRNSLDTGEEFTGEAGDIASSGRTVFTPDTWLSPDFFWPVISRRTRSEEEDGKPYLALVHVPNHKVVITDGNGNDIEPDQRVKGTDFYYLNRLAAAEGMKVKIMGEQLICCTLINGLWCITFCLPPAVLIEPSGPYPEFVAAMKQQLQADEQAAMPKVIAA